MDLQTISVRLVMYVPERHGFLMTYNEDDDLRDRAWRPVGGKKRLGEEKIPAAVREVREEMGIDVSGFEVIKLKSYLPSVARKVFLYFAVVPDAEARHMRSHGSDIAGLLSYDDLVAGAYKGVPVHSEYRKRILEEVMPMIDARAVT